MAAGQMSPNQMMLLPFHRRTHLQHSFSVSGLFLFFFVLLVYVWALMLTLIIRVNFCTNLHTTKFHARPLPHTRINSHIHKRFRSEQTNQFLCVLFVYLSIGCVCVYVENGALENETVFR